MIEVNFVDLRAHWDHALAYQLGFKKTEKLKNYEIFYGIEYTTTRISNTFNPGFYREVLIKIIFIQNLHLIILHIEIV